MQMKRHTAKVRGAVFMLLIYAMLITALFGMTFLVCSVYRTVLQIQNENEEVRTTLSFIETKLLSAETAGGVTLEGGVLYINEINEYETRLFVKDGYFCEELAKKGSPLGLSAQKLCEADSFEAQVLSDRLIEITLCGKSAILALRCDRSDTA